MTADPRAFLLAAIQAWSRGQFQLECLVSYRTSSGSRMMGCLWPGSASESCETKKNSQWWPSDAINGRVNWGDEKRNRWDGHPVIR
jgi:hypothetical protein